ncbi:NUDIX hydrolase N-terminal domain-containing protein [uncultured Flavobacterium sp.]|uniref:NUDIX hydrolase N-terminal domain-containing protein n=1 Tax=uncultured Flavobacterium sp. TaxID=165435 RepID=UPI0025E6CCF5|nr:NUDIX hydrolase N-terminal domain-containing protein [uncultured Flavobacterium sp.]
MKHVLLEEIKRLKAMADTGLLYAENEFDKNRYAELIAMSLRLMAVVSDNDEKTMKTLFLPVTEYPTVKTDVRALVLSGDKKQVLLARESVDGKWTLPGGWADIGDTPKEATEKEVREETGLVVEAKRLLAVFDKRMHPHPPQPYYIYKLVFYCEVVSGELQSGFDMLGAGFFDVDCLPELSTDRILESQIKLLHAKVLAGDAEAYFD